MAAAHQVAVKAAGVAKGMPVVESVDSVAVAKVVVMEVATMEELSLIHISEPTRPY